MKILPNVLPVSGLEVDEIFIEYEGPRLFSAKSGAGHMYLGLWAEERATEDVWLYVPVSSSRLTGVRTGAVPLRSAFSEAEDVVYVATQSIDADVPDAVETWQPADIPDTWLPRPWVHLEESEHTLPAMTNDAELRARGVGQVRTFLRLELDDPSMRRTEAPTELLGKLLTQTQLVYDTTGRALMGLSDRPSTGRIDSSVHRETASNVVALAAASFVVEIGSAGVDALTGSVFSTITQRLVKVLEPQNTTEQLRSILQGMDTRAVKSLRAWVARVGSFGGPVRLSAATPQGEFVSSRATHDQVMELRKRLAAELDRTVAVLRGYARLVAFDQERGRASFRDGDDKRYDCAAEDTVLRQLPVTEGLYEVLISETLQIDELASAQSAAHVLLQAVLADTDRVPTALARDVLG